jgi:Zinc finger, C3HC4 type (RING finger)
MIQDLEAVFISPLEDDTASEFSVSYLSEAISNDEDLLAKVSFSTTGNALCVICYSAPASARTLPCNHAVSCPECLSQAFESQPQQDHPCPVCRTPVESARLALSPFTDIPFLGTGMQRRRLRAGSFETASRAIRSAWPRWRQSSLVPTVLVIGTSKKILHRFLTMMANAYSPGNCDVRGGDVVNIDGMQFLPLLMANSSGRLDSGTVDLIRDGMHPTAVMLLADRHVVPSFRQLTICDLQLLGAVPALAQNVHWILMSHDDGDPLSGFNRFRSTKSVSVDPADIAAAKHYVGSPRPHYIIPYQPRNVAPAELQRLNTNIRRSVFLSDAPGASSGAVSTESDSISSMASQNVQSTSDSYATAGGSSWLSYIPNPCIHPPPPPPPRRANTRSATKRNSMLCCARPAVEN